MGFPSIGLGCGSELNLAVGDTSGAVRRNPSWAVAWDSTHHPGRWWTGGYRHRRDAVGAVGGRLSERISSSASGGGWTGHL